jgi:putative molybdopterin biosynthesis protein
MDPRRVQSMPIGSVRQRFSFSRRTRRACAADSLRDERSACADPFPEREETLAHGMMVSYYDLIVPQSRQQNRVKSRRLQKGWTQSELAICAGISRPAVSAIEMNRLSPSVAAALALSKALACSVEDLFGAGGEAGPVWAWPCPHEPCRYWQAAIRERMFLYPVEPTLTGMMQHDGVFQRGLLQPRDQVLAHKTLVLACCDPAAGLLAAQLSRLSGLRLIVLSRSSQQALALLKRGLVHVAGLHLATAEAPDRNRSAAFGKLEKEFRLLRVARWQEGIALSSHSSIKSVRNAIRSRLHWVGREPGSAARQCLEDLMPQSKTPRRIAFDHHGVAEAIRCGWADAGVCLRLVAEEAGLRFFPVREEIFELCFSADMESEPRILALREAVRAAEYRRQLADLPGYEPRECGEMHH